MPLLRGILVGALLQVALSAALLRLLMLWPRGVASWVNGVPAVLSAVVALAPGFVAGLLAQRLGAVVGAVASFGGALIYLTIRWKFPASGQTADLDGWILLNALAGLLYGAAAGIAGQFLSKRSSAD